MAYVMIDNMRMYYEEHGAPDGPPLVLLHGSTETGAFWRNQLAAFGDRYRLIVPDLRGHGRTDNPDGVAVMNLRQFAGDIIGLCRELGIKRTAFCGESSGAMALVSLASAAPELAAVCIIVGGTYYFSDEVRAGLRQQTPDTINEGYRVWLQAAHTAQGLDSWRRVIEARQHLGNIPSAENFPDVEEVRLIGAPVLIVHGDRDVYFPVEVPIGLYRLLPNAELCLLPNTNHLPPHEHPEWFNPIALDFLARRYSKNIAEQEPNPV